MGHKLDDNVMVTEVLQERLKEEAFNLTEDNQASWWCCAERSNGKLVEWEYGYKADLGEKLVAEQLVKTLNKEIHHDGAWVAQWLLNGTHLNVIWLDQDGDPQCPIEFNEDAAGMCEAPILHWVGQCEEAWHYWYEFMRRVLAPTPGQLFKKAMGQPKPTQATKQKPRLIRNPRGAITFH